MQKLATNKIKAIRDMERYMRYRRDVENPDEGQGTKKLTDRKVAKNVKGAKLGVPKLSDHNDVYERLIVDSESYWERKMDYLARAVALNRELQPKK